MECINEQKKINDIYLIISYFIINRKALKHETAINLLCLTK